MSTRQFFLVCGLVACGWLGTQVVSPLLAQQDADADKPAAVKGEDKQLNIRYAQAYLKVMEARLTELEERNRRSANTIRPAAIQIARECVNKAKLRLDSAQNEESNASQFFVLRAEAELRLTDESLRKTEAVNRRLPNTVGAAEIARLQAERDLARMRVERAKHLASESPLSNLRFEIDQLNDDLLDLQLQQAMARRGS